ncbi:MAG TPA: histidine kinase dimerization/phospho-acceptor domain-containing protein [Nitrospiria bacterium]|nr:histidine kinase dimerization/phospho-acceptor domain-containing protein [Nitrospiria bacterium]
MKNILVAEDSTEIKDVLVKLVGKGQSIVQLNASLDLDRLKEDKVDLALIEISGPLDRRYDLIQTLVDMNQDVKILLIFDSSLFNLAKPLLADNLFDFLFKPIDSDKLRRKIKLPLNMDTGIELSGLMRKITIEMAHRIKNPLTTIKTLACLLEERFDDPEFRGTFYRLCLKEVEGINAIIERLISYSSFEKPLLALADLNSIAREAIYNFTNHPNYRRLAISTDLQEDVPPVLVDRVQIRLILENILSYISAHNIDDGEVWIRSLRSSMKDADKAGVEISYPSRKEGLDENEFFSVDLFLASEVVRYQGGELSVLDTGRQEKLIAIRLPCCDGIEGMMRLDFHGVKGAAGDRDGSTVFNHYDRRKGCLEIPIDERRSAERRKGSMTLSLPEKRKILGVMANI